MGRILSVGLTSFEALKAADCVRSGRRKTLVNKLRDYSMIFVPGDGHQTSVSPRKEGMQKIRSFVDDGGIIGLLRRRRLGNARRHRVAEYQPCTDERPGPSFTAGPASASANTAFGMTI